MTARKPQVRIIVDDGSREAEVLRIRTLLESAEAMAQQAERAGVSKADADAFRSESAARTEKAYTLMEHHSITMAMLEAQGKARAETIEVEEFLIGKPFTGKATLLNGIAQNLNCVVIRMGKVGTTKEKMWAYGFKSDLSSLSMLFNSLDVQGMRYCAIDEKRQGIGKLKASEGGIHPPTYRRAWWTAYATEIWRRLDAAKQAAERSANTETPGTSLVLSDKRDRVRAVLEEKHPSLRKGRHVSRRRHEGYSEGRQAGQRVDLSANDKLGRERKAISG